MSEKNTKDKKQKQTRNKARDMIADYYRTNKAYDEENRRRLDKEGVRSKGLRNLNTTEKALVAIIVLGLIGIVVRYVIL